MRQLPTLPARCQASTLGSMRLNFRVRYGNGWVPRDMVTAMVERAKLHSQLQTKKKETTPMSHFKVLAYILHSVIEVLFFQSIFSAIKPSTY